MFGGGGVRRYRRYRLDEVMIAFGVGAGRRDHAFDRRNHLRRKLDRGTDAGSEIPRVTQSVDDGEVDYHRSRELAERRDVVRVEYAVGAPHVEGPASDFARELRRSPL